MIEIYLKLANNQWEYCIRTDDKLLSYRESADMLYASLADCLEAIECNGTCPRLQLVTGDVI